MSPKPDRETLESHRLRTALKLGSRAVGSFGRAARGLVLPTRFRKASPGGKPGIEHEDLAALPSSDEPVRVFCVDYSPEKIESWEVSDLEPFLSGHRPEWTAVRWINVDGINDMKVIEALARKYGLHPLAIEDVLHVPQRPKVDSYPSQDEYQARLFVICRMLQLRNEHLHSQQISIFLGHKTVLTFEETRGDAWEPIRRRLEAGGSRLRRGDASFLVYSLIDAIVDHSYPILEHYGDRLDELEDAVLARPNPDVAHEIHSIKRDLLLLWRAVWPMRDVVRVLQSEPHECMSGETRSYLRDVHDHTAQIVDVVETYREVATGLADAYLAAMSHRMNEVMKVLTVMGTIFIPLTFLAGVYGMNFQHMPEVHAGWAYPWAYPFGFWGLCLLIAVGMLAWFRRRGWL